MVRLKKFDEAADLEKRLEEIEHGMFIDTLIKITSNITSDSLLDYIPIYVCDRFGKNNQSKLLSLLESEVYISSFIGYLFNGRIRVNELVVIVKKHESRELLIRKILSTVINKDVTGFRRILKALKEKLEQ